jgi:NAD(P)-dependent dehydrogenase (short-subunit alcohol dehydrogenase family)
LAAIGASYSEIERTKIGIAGDEIAGFGGALQPSGIGASVAKNFAVPGKAVAATARNELDAEHLPKLVRLIARRTQMVAAAGFFDGTVLAHDRAGSEIAPGRLCNPEAASDHLECNKVDNVAVSDDYWKDEREDEL